MLTVRYNNRFREWRKLRGLTLGQVALKTGYTEKYLQQLERGIRKGTYNTWLTLAKAMQIPVAELFADSASAAALPPEREIPAARNFLNNQSMNDQ